MRELVVISGKGGTGKTSITASLAVLSGRCVVADCDVDAADLHLVLSPQIIERREYYSGHHAVIRPDACTGCGSCMAHCRFGAIRSLSAPDELGGSFADARYDCQSCDYCRRSCPAQASEVIRALTEAVGTARARFGVDPIACEGCGVCVRVCPQQAIDFPERLCGEWFISRTRCGPMVHARLGIAQGNSGRLVSLVRAQARRVAGEEGVELVLADGPPGVGCPVIASVTGASLILAVTEPTPAGEHDLQRVAQLARHFGLPLAVCVNKWDLNPGLSGRIEDWCRHHGIGMAGRVRYDRGVTRAQIERQAVVESQAAGGVADDIRALWAALQSALAST